MALNIEIAAIVPFLNIIFLLHIIIVFYSNQLLQIGTKFSIDDNIYGFGEHKAGLHLK